MLLVKDKVYKLDDQERAEKYAGAKLKVTGTVDAEGNAIHVKTTEPGSESAARKREEQHIAQNM